MMRTMLFLPGNNPGMLQSGGVFGADAVILDLEDAVSPLEKDAARLLAAHSLKNIDYRGSKRFVRINPLSDGGAADINAIVPSAPDGLVLPKCENIKDILKQIDLIDKAEKKGQRKVSIVPLIETPLGILQAAGIAAMHERISALAFGAEDYTAAVGSARSKSGEEILFARSIIVNAAAAASIDSIDTPFTDAADEDGLLQDTLLCKSLGFKGKLSINPRQVDTIHKAFDPSGKEIDWAERVLYALKQAEQQGSGVVSVDGKMVDAPVAARAKRIIELARLTGCYEEVLA